MKKEEIPYFQDIALNDWYAELTCLTSDSRVLDAMRIEIEFIETLFKKIESTE